MVGLYVGCSLKALVVILYHTILQDITFHVLAGHLWIFLGGTLFSNILLGLDFLCTRHTFQGDVFKTRFWKKCLAEYFKKKLPSFSLKALLPRQLPPVPDLQLLFYDRCAGDEPRLTKEMGLRSRICRAAKGLQ